MIDTMKRARDQAWNAWLTHVRKPLHLQKADHVEQDKKLWREWAEAQNVLNLEEAARQRLVQRPVAA